METQLKTAKYNYKEFVPATGKTRSYMYNCEVLGSVGRFSYRIKIIGAYYKGKPNAITTVRKINVILDDPEPIKNKDYNIKLPYKD